MKRQHGTGTDEGIPDWSREEPRRFWDPGRKLLQAIRRYQRRQRTGALLAQPACVLLVLQHRFWSVVTGADIPLSCKIGGGLLLPHPNGIVVHPEAVIGMNCLIFQQVTIGVHGNGGAPTIGNNVDIGAGAKVLGPVRLGSHAKVGANAVVIDDVPAGATVVGIPASRIA